MKIICIINRPNAGGRGKTEMAGEKTANRTRPAAEQPGADRACLEHDAVSLRCLCGSLLARYVAGGIELKCRRCKRAVIVPAPLPVPGPEQPRSF
jgi:hypothetical protein